MKTTLLTLVKTFLILAGLLLGVLLVFGVTLILDWPWWVGLYILLGIVGVVLGIIFIRKLWRKRREQRFITQVIEQDDQYLRQLSGKEKERFKELQDRWKEAITALRRSHLRKYGNPLYVLPWYLIIGESGSGKTTAIQSARLSSPFAEVLRTSGISGTRNCDWWFFEQAIVIDTAGRFAIPVDEGRDKDEWQKFLSLLARYRRKEPLNGLVVTVSANKLLEGVPEALEQDGKHIRQRINELMRVLGAQFPIYVLVTKCDLVQGMQQFCDQLPEKRLDQAMGVINTARDHKVDSVSFLDRVIGAVGDRLRDYRLLILNQPTSSNVHLSSSQEADPALLLFPEEFERLKPGLSAFIKGAFQEVIYQERPFLRGVFFSSGRQEGTPYSHFLKELGFIGAKEVLPGTDRGLFLHDLFSRVLPRDRALFVATQQALHWNRLTKNLGLTAWLAVGIALCGLLSYSFVKNLKTLRSFDDSLEKPLITSVTTEDIYEKMLRLTGYQKKISDLIEQNRSWWIPRFGLHQHKKVELELKRNYCDQFRDGIVSPLDDRLKTVMADFSDSTSDEIISRFAAHLIRRINLMKASKEDRRLVSLETHPYPHYILLSTRIDPAILTDIHTMFGGLFAYFLSWRSDSRQIDDELHDLQSRLDYLVTEQRTNLHWLVAWTNAKDSIPAVVLKDYWAGINPDPQPPGVSRAYTAEGKSQIDAFIGELESALPSGSPRIARQKLEFQHWYHKSYLEAWYAFSKIFHTGAESLKDQEQKRQMASVMGTDRNPYFRLIDQLATQFAPFVKSQELPVWAQQIVLFQNIRNEADRLPEEPAKEPSFMQKTTQKVKDKIAKLEKQTGLKVEKYWDPQEKRTAARAFADYRQALTALAEKTTPREAAFQAAVTLYTEDPEKSATPFFTAEKAIKKFKSVIPVDMSAATIFWQLVGGPLDYLQGYIENESACHLQTLWEQKVLWEVRAIPDGYQKIQRLVGKNGYAKKFVEEGPAAPFVAIGLDRGYYAKSVRGFSLPFENTFFSFLNKGGEIPDTVPNQYAVTIHGLPTNANPDARILPHGTRLELQCGNTIYRLVNRHYPIKKTFHWSRQNCGDVRLQILVGDLTLTRIYKGSQAFVEFLRDFAKGPKTFSADDFPEDSAELKSYGIKFIEVGYTLSGHDAVINPPGPTLGSVPQRIVRCGNP